MYLKKNLLGGYKEVELKDKADLVAYDLKEDKKKDTEINKLSSLLETEQKKREEEKTILKNRIAEITKEKDQKITKLNDDLKEAKETLKKLLDKYLELKSLQEHTQFRLDRAISIQVHRANSDRGLKPKKEHHGYLVVYKENSDIIKKFSTKSEKKTIIYSKSYSIWKYTVQTPYLLELDSQIVKEYIIKDLDKLGINIYNDFSISNSESTINSILEQKNIFNFALISNNKKYWHIKFLSGKLIEF